ncbi:hypothetical protein E1301_Tti011210 [Triplophysa tibetana]|uniref:Uncharacterized protein n=1 Tax=Triplophysa tibetana TaxID=1572043 RepID=A0A5A9MYA2_9TELE|nr:hypothetical protein E1301_Tti011210 [Triplophysa tibetana]
MMQKSLLLPETRVENIDPTLLQDTWSPGVYDLQQTPDREHIRSQSSPVSGFSSLSDSSPGDMEPRALESASGAGIVPPTTIAPATTPLATHTKSRLILVSDSRSALQCLQSVVPLRTVQNKTATLAPKKARNNKELCGASRKHRERHPPDNEEHKAEQGIFESVYDRKFSLGSGSFGVVDVAIRKSDGQEAGYPKPVMTDVVMMVKL